MNRLVLPLLAAALSLVTLGASHAHAQARLTFSGGSGTPLNITLTQPVVFTINTAANGSGIDFQGIGNIFNSSNTTVTGNITYQINTGTAASLTFLFTGAAGGAVATTDLGGYTSISAPPAVAVGNTVTIGAGTLTTSGNFAAAPPASGAYNAFIFDSSSGARVSNISVAPEPSTWVLLAAGAGALGFVTLRRRRAGRPA